MECFTVDLWIGNNARSSVVYRGAQTLRRVVGGLDDGNRRALKHFGETECEIESVYVGSVLQLPDEH